MRVFIISLFACAGLAGCITAEQRAEIQAQYEADSALAQRVFDHSLHGEQCIGTYQSRMHDPASFQLAEPLRYDDEKTRLYRTIRPDQRLIYFTAAIRGRNSYGGLVLNQLDCVFSANDSGHLMLYDAATRN
jgi:hypothetical protein